MAKKKKSQAASSARGSALDGLVRLEREGGRTAWHFADAPSPRSAGRDGASAVPPAAAHLPAPMPPPVQSPQSAAPTEMRFDHDGPTKGECVGTLRWSEKDSFPELPPWPRGLSSPRLSDWRAYLEARLSPNSKGEIRVEASMLDGLSYVLSLLYALQVLRLRPPSPGPLTLLMVGASSRAEERLMRDSTYWHELVHFLPGVHIELVFVGPEIDHARHGRTTKHHACLSSRCFHGTLGELLRKEPRYTADDTIVVGFNPGFGNASAGMARGGFALMQSWLPDLCALLENGFVGIFTCANDYSDLRGELAIFRQLLKAEFVLPPQKNPFKAATVVRESDDDACEWSCSSCYVYAVCNRVDGAAPLPPGSKAATAHVSGGRAMDELRETLKKLAKQLARTQTVSKVP